jgi:hypothetical protein
MKSNRLPKVNVKKTFNSSFVLHKFDKKIISVTHQSALFNKIISETLCRIQQIQILEKDFSSSSSTTVEGSQLEGILYSFIVLLLFALFAFQLWFHALAHSATIDEPVHILAGYRYLQCGDFGITRNIRRF